MKPSEQLARLRGVEVPEKRPSLQALLKQINREHEAVLAGIRMSLAHAVRCGELLTEAKPLVLHGEWEPWVERNCEFSARTAQRYMQIAENYPALLEAKASNVSLLSFRGALKLLTSGDESIHFSSASTEWYTPADIITRAVATLGHIELDPCAATDSKIDAYSHFTEADDGLTRPWFGSVYMNPPYGSVIGDWVEKLCGEYGKGNVSEAIALVPARVDTEWFAMFRDFAVCFVRGRLKFSGQENSAPFPSAVIHLGKDNSEFVRTFEPIGDIWARMRQPLKTSISS